MRRVLLCFAASGPWTCAAAYELSGPAVVLAGDTLEVAGERVRLRGVDAPGLAQRCRRAAGIEWRCGLLARMKLDRRIDGRSVSCKGEERDGYGQRLATCRVGGDALGAWLVEQGWALAAEPLHAEGEAAARAAGRGLWHDGFEPSSDWRLAAGFPHRIEDQRALGDCSCAARHRHLRQRRQP